MPGRTLWVDWEGSLRFSERTNLGGTMAQECNFERRSAKLSDSGRPFCQVREVPLCVAQQCHFSCFGRVTLDGLF